MQSDKILLSKGYGVANPEYDIPDDSEALFRLGSMTKQFTAMGIMVLKGEGKYFFMKVTDAKVDFIYDKGGVKGLLFRQGGQSFEAKRVD